MVADSSKPSSARAEVTRSGGYQSEVAPLAATPTLAALCALAPSRGLLPAPPGSQHGGVEIAPLGPFLLEAEIGEGGMATVFRGRHHLDGTPVAVKVLKPQFALDPQFAEQFRFEVRAVAALDHPRITAVFDHGTVSPQEARFQVLPQGAPWLAMEFVGGGIATSLLGHIGWRSMRGLLLGVLDGLAHAHAHGVVHRDIKPANVLLREQARGVKLTDFGLAHTVSGDASPTDEDFVGTPSYMAPEQIEVRWRDFGPWTDLYAVGGFAWALATGLPPYAGSTATILAGHLSGHRPPFEPVVGVPRGLESWIDGLMAVRSRDRFQRAADAASALVQLGEPDEESIGEFDAGATTTFAALDINKEPSGRKKRRWWQIGRQVDEEEEDEPSIDTSARPPLPSSWRGRETKRRHLHGAGLALYGQRAIGLVGREQERDRLWKALRTVIDTGRARFVLIEGTAGSGKTALARWIVHRSAEVGASQTLWATHSESGGAADGLGPMLARELRGVGLSRPELADRVQAHLRGLGVDNRDEALALAELAYPSADEDLGGEGLGVRFSGPKERHAVLGRYVTACAVQRPVVLWLDDLHHGRDAQAFVAHLLLAQDTVPTPVLVVATARSEALAQDFVRAQALRALIDLGGEQIELAALAREEASALVRDLLGLEPKLAAQVEARASGNPLFAVQLVGDWVARGLLVPGDRGYRLAGGAEAGFPTDLIGVWRARLAPLLKEDTGHSLEIAALLGQSVDAEEWEDACAAAGVEREVGLLDELFRLRLAARDRRAASWEFAHGMLREALESRAKDAGRLTRWSTVCADVLEGKPDAAARRARHLVRAGRTEDAVQGLWQAVVAELRQGEFPRARELHDLRNSALDSLNVGPDDPLRAESLVLEARILRRTGKVQEAANLARKALDQARAAEDPHVLVQALTAAGNCVVSVGDSEAGLELLKEGKRLAQKLRLHDESASLSNNLAFVAMRAGQLDDARSAARQAALGGEAAGSPHTVAQAYSMLARVAWQQGDLDRALFYLDEARLRFEALGARWGLATTVHTLGEVRRVTGELAAAEAAYREAVGRYEACGSGDAVFARLNLGLTQAERGHFDAAEEQLRAVERELERSGRTAMLGAVRALLLFPLASLERWQEFDWFLPQAEHGLKTSGLVDLDLARHTRMTAEACDAMGEDSRGARVWRISLAQWQALGRPKESAEARAALGDGA